MADQLTEERVHLVTASWDLVRKDLKGNGIKFFVAFFTAYPEYQQLFKQLKDVPLDELAQAPKLKAHASVVMNNINALIDNLSQPECVVEILRKIVVTHKPRGITPQHFENLFGVLLSFLASALGDAFTAETKGAWVATAGAVVGIVKSIET